MSAIDAVDEKNKNFIEFRNKLLPLFNPSSYNELIKNLGYDDSTSSRLSKKYNDAMFCSEYVGRNLIANHKRLNERVIDKLIENTPENEKQIVQNQLKPNNNYINLIHLPGLENEKLEILTPERLLGVLKEHKIVERVERPLSVLRSLPKELEKEIKKQIKTSLKVEYSEDVAYLWRNDTQKLMRQIHVLSKMNSTVWQHKIICLNQKQKNYQKLSITK